MPLDERIRLCAVPDSLTKGTVKGIPARTQTTVDDLTWSLDAGKIDLTVTSGIDQTLELLVGRGIEHIDAEDGVLAAPLGEGAQECMIHLSASHPTTLHPSVDRTKPSEWIRSMRQ
jgi:hypothetical protein